MIIKPPVLLRVTAHNTPHYTDPSDANEFYAALGMLTVAWGRLEGHVIGNLLTIMNLPELAPSRSLPLVWKARLDLWTKGFSLVPDYNLIRTALLPSCCRSSKKRRIGISPLMRFGMNSCLDRQSRR
jgi:hypothetical protein